MAGIRSFVALPAPSALRIQIAELIRGLQSIPSDVKWEQPEKVHLTLRFLGTVEPRVLEGMANCLRDVCSYLSPFEMTYEGLGAFPNRDRPRVLWIGVRANEALSDLQRRVEQCAIAAGLEPEDRDFHPHVTIGRVKGFRQIDRLTASVKSLTLQPVLTLCNTVLVVQSELHPTGSRYTVVHSISLSS